MTSRHLLALALIAVGVWSPAFGQDQVPTLPPAPSAAIRREAAAALKAATTQTAAVAGKQRSAMKQDIQHADAAKVAYLRAMYRKHLPQGVAKAVAPPGEQILMFASMSMTPTDMHGLLEAALSDPRITIKFLGGEAKGGLPALIQDISNLTHGMKSRPSFQIDPPSFHKYHVTQVPYAVVLRNGREVARVGGVVDSRWIDEQLRTRSGDLGDYGRMSFPSELDMGAQIADRIRHFDWHGYVDQAVAGFWRHLKMPRVPHATKAETYRIDPSVTITRDIRASNGLVIAKAGTRVNPLKVAPFDVELVVIDASDPAQRAFARQRLQSDAKNHVKVLSTTVPATAADGWAVWAQWEHDIGTHLYAYLPAMASRMNLTGTPSVVTGDGLLVKVQQIALPGSAGEPR